MRNNKKPEIKLDHLYRMTDGVGILEHSVMATPDLREGYCVDDNARALMLAGALTLRFRLWLNVQNR